MLKIQRSSRACNACQQPIEKIDWPRKKAGRLDRASLPISPRTICCFGLRPGVDGGVGSGGRDPSSGPWSRPAGVPTDGRAVLWRPPTGRVRSRSHLFWNSTFRTCFLLSPYGLGLAVKGRPRRASAVCQMKCWLENLFVRGCLSCPARSGWNLVLWACENTIACHPLFVKICNNILIKIESAF